ncbi:MAG: hypothetical protein JNK43_04795 [Ignavibacteria bacterium]|nr:hypothetical protein [Ignavibacteria bacterium]
MNHFVRCVLLAAPLTFAAYSQDKSPVNVVPAIDALNTPVNNTDANRTVIKLEHLPEEPQPFIEFYRYELTMFAPQRSEQEEKFDPVSSFRSNIRFGGFWDRYAIVNYTPALNITPLSFIDVSAYHNMSYFVPVKAVKEHFKSMALQSAAVMGIETVFRYIKIFPPMLQQIISFFCKNALLQFMQKRVLNEGTDRIFRQVNYYYNLRIRF